MDFNLENEVITSNSVEDIYANKGDIKKDSVINMNDTI